MVKITDFDAYSSRRRSSGVLYINIYPVLDYPRKIRISKVPYTESSSSGKWRKRIGSFVYYYGNCVNENFDEININDPLFGAIFRKYLLDVLSENIVEPWQLEELGSTLRIVKKIVKDYGCLDKIKLQYELIINVHHWQSTKFGIVADVKINIIDRKTNRQISYPEIKDKYGENVSKSIWKTVQALHKHLTKEGKKYATAMRDKFNLITSLIKEAFKVSENEKILDTSDGEIKIILKPLEVVEVSRDVDGV